MYICAAFTYTKCEAAHMCSIHIKSPTEGTFSIKRDLFLYYKKRLIFIQRDTYVLHSHKESYKRYVFHKK